MATDRQAILQGGPVSMPDDDVRVEAQINGSRSATERSTVAAAIGPRANVPIIVKTFVNMLASIQNAAIVGPLTLTVSRSGNGRNTVVYLMRGSIKVGEVTAYKYTP